MPGCARKVVTKKIHSAKQYVEFIHSLFTFCMSKLARHKRKCNFIQPLKKGRIFFPIFTKLINATALREPLVPNFTQIIEKMWNVRKEM